LNRGETTIRDTEVRVIEYSEGFYREDVIKDINQFSALTDKSKVTWIKVCGLLDREEITKLAEKFNIHPLTLEDILNTDQRPKIEEFYNYTYIVLRIFQFDPLEKELLSEQMSIIVGENFLISVEEKTNTAIQKIIDWIKSSRGIIRRMGIDYLLYLIIDEVINGYFLVLEEIEDRLEELEDELTTNPTSSTLQAIHRFKRQLLQFNKNTWPLREVIGTLGRTGHRFIDNQTIHFLETCTTIQLEL
jgi:magnesium transporter